MKSCKLVGFGIDHFCLSKTWGLHVFRQVATLAKAKWMFLYNSEHRTPAKLITLALNSILSLIAPVMSRPLCD